jgi:segregation and condensation protein B
MDLSLILESILFASQKPLSLRELRDLLNAAAEKSEDAAVQALRRIKEEPVLEALATLEKFYNDVPRSFRLACIAGSWQFVSHAEYAPWLKALLGEKNRPTRLSQPALETLTIIAYRQPLTRAEMEQIRGVAVDGVVSTLLERGLIENAGRAEVIGRPMTYKTTAQFLEYFGLRSLNELPSADELRRLPVERPPALLTVEPGLAIAPPTDINTTASAEAAVTAEAASFGVPALAGPPSEQSEAEADEKPAEAGTTNPDATAEKPQ